MWCVHRCALSRGISTPILKLSSLRTESEFSHENEPSVLVTSRRLFCREVSRNTLARRRMGLSAGGITCRSESPSLPVLPFPASTNISLDRFSGRSWFSLCQTPRGLGWTANDTGVMPRLTDPDQAIICPDPRCTSEVTVKCKTCANPFPPSSPACITKYRSRHGFGRTGHHPCLRMFLIR